MRSWFYWLPLLFLAGLFLTQQVQAEDDGAAYLPVILGAASPTQTPIPTGALTPTTPAPPSPTATPTNSEPDVDPVLVFVSRQIPTAGSVYWDEAKDLPGVGAYSRLRVAAPGKLLVRSATGRVRTLIDGSNPTAASLNLIDVNAPDVAYDGRQIVFAGLPAGDYDLGPANTPNAWRLYAINADGSALRQLTFSDQTLDLSQFDFAAGGLAGYDDTDPAWLPDGRIVFVSTRWPSFAQYSGVRTSNLYVVNADGSNLHRITAERNGADRPQIDPQTGKIVFTRWWRNHRFPAKTTATIPDPAGGYVQHNGLTSNRADQYGGGDYLWRNAWHLGTINPDGAGLALWSGAMRNEEANHAYGGVFAPDGSRFIANYYPMFNMSEAAGFGGLRIFRRGAERYTPLLGITYLTLDYVSDNPTSYGIFKGDYATDAVILPDGQLVLSFATDHLQDYGLYTANADGSDLTPLYDLPGTTEIRARLLAPRPLPPIITDRVTAVAGLLPPTAEGPYDTDGVFVYEDLNVYFNGPVDMAIVNAPPIGSAKKIRFFLDHQRTSPGSFQTLDWPILLKEAPIGADGFIREASAPADLPLFEQILGEDGHPPFTSDPFDHNGATHVAGMNYAPPGSTFRCVGCHAGHTLIPVPDNAEDAAWTNLAPGAVVTVSSTHNADYDRGVVDRQVQLGEIWRYWTSATDLPAAGQWVQLTFPTPIRIRTVRLYNPRFGDDADSTLQVHQATVRLYSDVAGVMEVAHQTLDQDLAVTGSNIAFDDVLARVVRVEIDEVSGVFYNAEVAGLAEIEVVGRGE